MTQTHRDPKTGSCMPLELPVQRIKTLLRAGNQKVKLTGEGTQIKQKRRLFWGVIDRTIRYPFPKFGIPFSRLLCFISISRGDTDTRQVRAERPGYPRSVAHDVAFNPRFGSVARVCVSNSCTPRPPRFPSACCFSGNANIRCCLLL